MSCVIVYDLAMDAVAGLLDGPRARDASLLRSSRAPPWSLRIEDEAPLTIVALVRGEAWIVPEDAPADHLGEGDVAVIRGPDPYTLAEDPATAPQGGNHPRPPRPTPAGDHPPPDMGSFFAPTRGEPPR